MVFQNGKSLLNINHFNSYRENRRLGAETQLGNLHEPTIFFKKQSFSRAYGIASAI